MTAVPDAMTAAVDGLLARAGIAPVLIDIGCSGTRHAIWDPFAARSTLIAFDPDGRALPSGLAAAYARAEVVPQAVCAADDAQAVEFVLTRFPYSSSTLEPNLDALADYAFRDYFIPVERVQVPATSLNRVAAARGLESLDWIKLDSQGTDLRILRGIAPALFSRVLAIDVEPGLIDAYRGEDLFVDTHAWLVANGYWLADLQLQRYPRVRPENLAQLAARHGGLDPEDLLARLPGSPTAAEARYLRRPAGVESARDLLLLGVFALVDGRAGFAFDVAQEYARRWPQDPLGPALADAVVGLLRAPAAVPGVAAAMPLRSGLREVARALLGRRGRRLARRLRDFVQGTGRRG